MADLIRNLTKDKLFTKRSLRHIAVSNLRIQEQFSRKIKHLERERAAKTGEIKLHEKLFRRKEQHLLQTADVRSDEDEKEADEDENEADVSQVSPESSESDGKKEHVETARHKCAGQMSLASRPLLTLPSIVETTDDNISAVSPLITQSYVTTQPEVSRSHGRSRSIAASRRVSRQTQEKSEEEELEFKRLALRLHRKDASVTDPELMTDNEKKIYRFLKKTVDACNTTHRKLSLAEPHEETSRYDQVNRVYADKRLSDRLSLTLFEMLFEKDQDRFRRRQHHDLAPVRLPPIHKHKPFRFRQQRRGSVLITDCLTTADWRSLERCRYLRPPIARFNMTSDSDGED